MKCEIFFFFLKDLDNLKYIHGNIISPPFWDISNAECLHVQFQRDIFQMSMRSAVLALKTDIPCVILRKRVLKSSHTDTSCQTKPRKTLVIISLLRLIRGLHYKDRFSLRKQKAVQRVFKAVVSC